MRAGRRFTDIMMMSLMGRCLCAATAVNSCLASDNLINGGATKICSTLTGYFILKV